MPAAQKDFFLKEEKKKKAKNEVEHKSLWQNYNERQGSTQRVSSRYQAVNHCP